jgi:hypothetical protein
MEILKTWLLIGLVLTLGIFGLMWQQTRQWVRAAY